MCAPPFDLPAWTSRSALLSRHAQQLLQDSACAPPLPSPFSMAQQSRSLVASSHMPSTKAVRTATEGMGLADRSYSDAQMYTCCAKG